MHIMRSPNFLLRTGCGVAIASVALAVHNPAYAAGLTSSSLPSTISVDGIDYEVTFFQSPSGTIFDDIFGSNGSQNETTPTFNGQVSLAREARDQIVNLLGNNTAVAFPGTPTVTSGNFVVPSAVSSNEYRGPAGGLSPLSGPLFQSNGELASLSRNISNQGVLSIATFSETLSSPPTAVPTPALFPGLIGFGVSVLRKRNQAKD